jgi:hypothetical protein
MGLQVRRRRNVPGSSLTSASTHGIKLKLLSAAGKFIIRHETPFPSAFPK